MTGKRTSDKRSRRLFIAVFVLFVAGLAGALVWGGGLVKSPKEGDLNSERPAGGQNLKPQSF